MPMSTELIAGVSGALIGGGLSIVGSWFSINKQFSEQRKLFLEQEEIKQRTALISVQEEITHNFKVLSAIKSAIFEHLQKDYHKYSEDQFRFVLKDTSWEKHSDAVRMVNTLSDFETIQNFYIKISIANSFNHIDEDMVKTLIENCDKCNKILSKHIELISKR